MKLFCIINVFWSLCVCPFIVLHFQDQLISILILVWLFSIPNVIETHVNAYTKLVSQTSHCVHCIFRTTSCIKPEKQFYFLLPSYVACFLIYLNEIISLQMEKYMSAYWNCIITICVAKLMYQMMVLTWELVIPICINTFFLFCLSRLFLFLLAFLCQFSNAAL